MAQFLFYLQTQVRKNPVGWTRGGRETRGGRLDEGWTPEVWMRGGHP